MAKRKSNFVRDLALGNAGENILISELSKFGVSAETSSSKEFDVIASLNNTKRTFEVKYDMYCARSGNIAIEYYNPKSKIPSGLTATKADYWTHIITGPIRVYCCPLEKLKNFIENNKPDKVIECGGDDNASLYLYKKDFILEKAFHILDEDFVNSIFREVR
jgi:hypothetical protein